jgi:uncharacterized protein with PIN domain
MIKLKNCPFCNGRALLMMNSAYSINVTDEEVINQISSYWIKCEECETSSWTFGDHDSAVKHWNNSPTHEILKL